MSFSVSIGLILGLSVLGMVLAGICYAVKEAVLLLLVRLYRSMMRDAKKTQVKERNARNRAAETTRLYLVK